MKQFIDENNNGVYTEKALMNLNQIKLEKYFNKETNKYETISVKSKLKLENCKSENF